MSISGIYKITNTVNRKFYIGSSIDIRRRWRQHRRGLALGAHINPKLQRAWNKYGANNFTFEIVELTNNTLQREEYYFKTLKPHYNICLSVFDLTKLNNPNWRGGSTFCWCDNRISTYSKTCGNCRNRLGKNNPFFGKQHSLITKNKLRKQMLGKKPINQRSVCIEGKNYPSATEAGRQLNVCTATILFRIKSKYWDYQYV